MDLIEVDQLTEEMTPEPNERRTLKIWNMAQAIATTSQNENERAFASMIVATAEEILNLYGWQEPDKTDIIPTIAQVKGSRRYRNHSKKQRRVNI